jgi:hypothetical protein
MSDPSWSDMHPEKAMVLLLCAVLVLVIAALSAIFWGVRP